MKCCTCGKQLTEKEIYENKNDKDSVCDECDKANLYWNPDSVMEKASSPEAAIQALWYAQQAKWTKR